MVRTKSTGSKNPGTNNTPSPPRDATDDSDIQMTEERPDPETTDTLPNIPAVATPTPVESVPWDHLTNRFLAATTPRPVEPVGSSDDEEAGPPERPDLASAIRVHRTPHRPGQLFDLTASRMQEPFPASPAGGDPAQPTLFTGPPYPRVVHIEYSTGISNFSFRILPRTTPGSEQRPASVHINIDLDIPDPGDDLDTITVQATLNAPTAVRVGDEVVPVVPAPILVAGPPPERGVPVTVPLPCSTNGPPRDMRRVLEEEHRIAVEDARRALSLQREYESWRTPGARNTVTAPTSPLPENVRTTGMSTRQTTVLQSGPEEPEEVNSPGSRDLNANGDGAPADPFVVSSFSPHTSDEDFTETETEDPIDLAVGAKKIRTISKTRRPPQAGPPKTTTPTDGTV